jgi:hypothetical protein
MGILRYVSLGWQQVARTAIVSVFAHGGWRPGPQAARGVTVRMPAAATTDERGYLPATTTPQAMRGPELPAGWLLKSSGSRWITTARPITLAAPLPTAS